LTATQLACATKRLQLVAVEHRQALARIEDERDAGAAAARVLEHRVAAVGRDDRDADVVARGHLRQLGRLHRAGVERSDLVVVGIGDDDRLRRVGVRHSQHVLRARPPGLQALRILLAVAADGRHHERLAAEPLQGIGDVARAPAELAPERRHEKRHVQDVDLLGQDLLREAAGKNGDGVKREGSADQCRHGRSRKGERE
jgi:hypothetical protein